MSAYTDTNFARAFQCRANSLFQREKVTVAAWRQPELDLRHILGLRRRWRGLSLRQGRNLSVGSWLHHLQTNMSACSAHSQQCRPHTPRHARRHFPPVELLNLPRGCWLT